MSERTIDQILQDLEAGRQVTAWEYARAVEYSDTLMDEEVDEFYLRYFGIDNRPEYLQQDDSKC